MLLGYDPEDKPEVQLPVSQPQVTYAYCKHLWQVDKKPRAFDQLNKFLNAYVQIEDVDTTIEERHRLLAR